MKGILYDDYCYRWRRIYWRKFYSLSLKKTPGRSCYLRGQTDLCGQSFHAEASDGQPELPVLQAGHLRPGGDLQTVRRREAGRGDQLRGREPCGPVDRGSGDLPADEHHRHSDDDGCGAEVRKRAVPPGIHGRSIRGSAA